MGDSEDAAVHKIPNKMKQSGTISWKCQYWLNFKSKKRYMLYSQVTVVKHGFLNVPIFFPVTALQAWQFLDIPD